MRFPFDGTSASVITTPEGRGIDNGIFFFLSAGQCLLPKIAALSGIA
jgi:hypothetical protein